MITARHIKAARALLGWTQERLALEAELGQSTVADFERGARGTTKANINAMVGALLSAGIEFRSNGVLVERDIPDDNEPHPHGPSTPIASENDQ